jgi:3-methyl-2-oxobutanoate hydroxymethyltransferase
LRDDARAVADAGASLLVLECVPTPVAAAITADLAIPTIGIGAGPQCDGQVLVLHDLLGLDGGHRRPKFVKDFLADGGSIAGAVAAYVAAVRDGSFPDDAHSYAA